MLEREVVAPLQEVEDLLAREGQPGTGSGTTELGRIQASVEDLLAREEEVERRFEEQENLLLAQAGFAQVGELAAEMAHEFKRPLASIVTALQLFDQEYELEGTSRVVMDEVNDQLSRLTGTMQDLFSLAKPVALDRERVDPRELMDDCLMEARSHPGAEAIRFVRNYAPDAPVLWAEERRLKQALTNVLVNAVEAMPEGGTITVSIQPMGDCGILFKIQDEGAGIPKEEVEKAFKPFYSTKPLGTGLGLPLVVRVVRSHRGKLGIESTPGEGTTVRICLPLYEPDAETTELCGCEAPEFSSSTTIS
jgi:signal transduction histidine kinase